jgi:hypothetical protein
MKELYETAELDITLFECDDLLDGGSGEYDTERDNWTETQTNGGNP